MVCDFLPQLCDDPALRLAKVNHFCQVLTDNYPRTVAVVHSLIGHSTRMIPKVLPHAIARVTRRNSPGPLKNGGERTLSLFRERAHFMTL